MAIIQIKLKLNNVFIHKSLQKDIAKFWEIEEIADQKFFSEVEYEVENFYKETTCYDTGTGRIKVHLPFNKKSQC